MCGQYNQLSDRLCVQEDRDMSVSVIVEGTVKEMDAFEALLLKELPATRSYEGCEGLTVHRNMDEPANVVLIERWETRAHYDKYLAWCDETIARPARCAPRRPAKHPLLRQRRRVSRASDSQTECAR